MVDWMSALGDDGSTRSRRRMPESLRKELYKKQGGKCVYCGYKVRLELMHDEHKTRAHSRGGSLTEKNSQLACGPCNSRKGDLTDGQFREKYKSLGLLPAKQANGKPPSRPIPHEKFKEVTKQKAKARRRRASEDDFSFF